VYVVVPRTNKSKRKPSFEEDADPNVEKDLAGSGPNSQTNMTRSLEEQILTDNPGFYIVNELSYGASLGEIALRQRGARTATIVAKDDTHFAVLTHEAYRRLIAQYHEYLYKQKVGFLRQISIFRNWPTPNVEALINHFNVLNFDRNHVIYSEGDPPTFIYFIKSGEVEVCSLLAYYESA
jgi:CRP-like cAMP-binding protein